MTYDFLNTLKYPLLLSVKTPFPTLVSEPIPNNSDIRALKTNNPIKELPIHDGRLLSGFKNALP
jgi:hypothetical protein